MFPCRQLLFPLLHLLILLLVSTQRHLAAGGANAGVLQVRQPSVRLERRQLSALQRAELRRGEGEEETEADTEADTELVKDEFTSPEKAVRDERTEDGR